MSQDPFQALYSGIGGALLLHLTTIESIYPTVCVCVRCQIARNKGVKAPSKFKKEKRDFLGK